MTVASCLMDAIKPTDGHNEVLSPINGLVGDMPIIKALMTWRRRYGISNVVRRGSPTRCPNKAGDGPLQARLQRREPKIKEPTEVTVPDPRRVAVGVS